jgi:CheY-like chemotaxis protein
MKAKKILYVDDENDIREVAQMSLELDPGFYVRACPSGASALAEAAQWQPDIILLDVMMPEMDGPETLRRLQANPSTAGIAVVFITARTQTHEVERYKSLGAAGVIAKPFDPMSLARTVRSFIALPPACH